MTPMDYGLTKEAFEKLMTELQKELQPSPFENLFSNSLFKPQPIEIPEPKIDNTHFRFMSRMWGIPIYTSNHMPTEEVVKVRGIPSSRKPNSRRPYYRKVTIKNHVIYAVKGMGIVGPPGYLASIA